MATKPTPTEIQTNADAMPEDHVHPQFASGQRVRDIYGHEHVVDRQNECCVYVRGQSGWHHPSKLHPAD